jgi:hypothetical protein
VEREMVRALQEVTYSVTLVIFVKSLLNHFIS